MFFGKRPRGLALQEGNMCLAFSILALSNLDMIN